MSRQERTEIIKADFALSAEQLDEKYNPEGYGEHPVFTRGDWISDVFHGYTLRGYWDWLVARIEEEMDELDEEEA